MKNQINLENHADNENTRPSRLLSHTRVNPTTGQVDYYFPKGKFCNFLCFSRYLTVMVVYHRASERATESR